METEMTPTTEAPESSEVTQNTVPQGEPQDGERGPIPYDRFKSVVEEKNRVADRVAELEAKLAAIDAAKADAERKAAEEQGHYKELYEQAMQTLADRDAAIEAERRENLRKTIGAKYNLTPRLIARLQGDTEAELEADAKALAEELPAPAAPNIDSHRIPANRVDTVTPEEFRAMSFKQQQELYQRDPDLFKKLISS